MFTVSFRILFAWVHNKPIFINGSLLSSSYLNKDIAIEVCSKEMPGRFNAQVIESVATKREPSTYGWNL